MLSLLISSHFSETKIRQFHDTLNRETNTLVSDEDILCLEIAMVDILVEEVATALGELDHEGQCLELGDVSVLLEIVFQVAA